LCDCGKQQWPNGKNYVGDGIVVVVDGRITWGFGSFKKFILGNGRTNPQLKCSDVESDGTTRIETRYWMMKGGGKEEGSGSE